MQTFVKTPLSHLRPRDPYSRDVREEVRYVGRGRGGVVVGSMGYVL